MDKQSVFIDTSGFYALLTSDDVNHKKSNQWLLTFIDSNNIAFTSDYIIDETLTLLKSREKSHLCSAFLGICEQTKALQIEFTDASRFQSAKNFFIKHIDHDYSFTDCVSFIIMKELNLSKALTADKHFLEAGFEPILL